MSAHAATSWRAGSLLGEAAKLPAFLRRDLLMAWSYRMAFFSDFVNLGAQMLLFFYIGKLVPSTSLPTYGGVQATYVEFVTLGIVINVFVQVALTRIADALRQEQLMGTLESLLVTPTATTTLQLGSGRLRPRVHAAPHRDLPRLHGPLRRSWARGFGRAARGGDPARVHPIRVGHRHRQRGRDPDLQARCGCNDPRGAPARASPRAHSSLSHCSPLGSRQSPNTTRWRSPSRGSARRCLVEPARRAWPTTSSCWSRSRVWRSSSARSSSDLLCGANGAAERWGSIEHSRTGSDLRAGRRPGGALTLLGGLAPPPCRAARGPALARAWARAAYGPGRSERMAAATAMAAPALLERTRTATEGPLLLVKGPEVARLYPDPALRCFRDLDILVPDAPRLRASCSPPAFRRRATRACTSGSITCVRCSGRGCRSSSRSTARRSGSPPSTRRRWPS